MKTFVAIALLGALAFAWDGTAVSTDSATRSTTEEASSGSSSSDMMSMPYGDVFKDSWSQCNADSTRGAYVETNRYYECHDGSSSACYEACFNWCYNSWYLPNEGEDMCRNYIEYNKPSVEE